MKTLLETDLAVALSTGPLQLLRKDTDFSKMYTVITDKLDNIKFGRRLAIKKKEKVWSLSYLDPSGFINKSCSAPQSTIIISLLCHAMLKSK